MKLKPVLSKFKRYALPGAFVLGIVSVFVVRAGLKYTSSDEFCDVCHVHPHSTTTWKQGLHRDTESGTVVHCVECHLPPEGLPYLTEKVKVGIRDLYGTIFKDVTKIDWEQKSRRENAVNFTFEKSCLHCHQNLFSKGLSKKGEDAHLYYERNAENLRCINCHLEVGHYHEQPVETMELPGSEKARVIFKSPAQVDSFVNFEERIPGSAVSFEMIAIPGGEFRIGSPPSEPYRDADEGPQKTVRLTSFWMGKAEVSWDEFDTFIRQTAGEGRTEDQYANADETGELDVVTGPTPAYGNPDQGWGRGKRPAITMTHYAAQKYCEWLSQITGKRYRLPTEAEWEYAARANTGGAYFFAGSPKKYTEDRFWNSIFGADTSVISSYVIYKANSDNKTHPPSKVEPNPFGLVNMAGNAYEFCSDYYAPDYYERLPENAENPTGPATGNEYVIRGGSYKDDAADVRVADRSHTRYDSWMLTDPQIPKSLWWYSDNNEVGFRVVCEYRE